ncbi:MAG: recombinase family protein [Actinomycetota bacterium]|nr:recombinase family protein [Actinomycetota bacterium]
MPSTNGHGPKRAILYARVSTEEQARSGYSLAQQIEALREYAGREGYEVLEEVADPGQSGASLERPGMDHIRDLVATGGVSVVLAQDRDRFAREPAYHYLLRREFEEHGTKIRALNDRGDGSPEGELTDGILDQLGKYERAKIAERSRRGKMRKAREGKVMAGRRVKYGFKLNAARDGLLVDEERMRLVRRIFRMVGEEGLSINAVFTAFEREGMPTPGGGKHWDRTFFRLAIMDDAYRPHTYETIQQLVSPDVAARLDPEGLYGVWYYNRLRVKTRQVSEPSENGRRYRTEARFSVRPKEEWVAVPVPYAGIPRELVDAAREAIKDNRVPSKAGLRFWQLSGGILRCGLCGRSMTTRSIKARAGTYHHHYYHCPAHHQHGDAGCTNRKYFRAENIEGPVWEMVAGLLRDPERLRAGLDELIEAERAGLRGDPEAEAVAWLDRLTALERKRSRLQDMAAEGHITLDELGAKLRGLEEERKTAERELDGLRLRRTRLEELERDKAGLLAEYAEMVPEALEDLTGEERHQVYRMLRLRVWVRPDGPIEVEGVLREAVCTPTDTPWSTRGRTGGCSSR